MVSSNEISVLLHNKKIGTITLLPGERNLFAFDNTYIEDKNRSVFSLSFKSQIGNLIDKPQISKLKLPPFFSNLLPEGPLREYLAKKVGINPEREFFLLAALGADLPGSIETKCGDNKKNDVMKDEENIAQITTHKGALHFSLAGVQLKFSVIKNAKRLTIPTYGVGGSWIVKLPSAAFPLVPENEFSMMHLASRVGIDVPNIDLMPISSIANLPDEIYQTGNVYAIKRFDRTDKGEHIHMEDFAQIFGIYPAKKYEIFNYSNIAFVIWAEIGEQGLAQFVKRLVFSALIGNGDMHLKNWSLIYPDKKNAALSPAYDLVSTILYIENDHLALNVAGTKEMGQFSIDLLKRLAVKAKVPEALVTNNAREIVTTIKSVWKSFKTDTILPKQMIDRIEKHMKSIPLYSEK